MNDCALGSFGHVSSLAFAPYGKHMAFSATQENEVRVYMNDDPGRAYSYLLVVPRANIQFDGRNELHYLASARDKSDHWHLVQETLEPRTAVV